MFKRMPRCDPTKPNAESPVPHEYRPDGDECVSLADGASFERLKCRRCGRVAYLRSLASRCPLEEDW
jgi:hypothetical protein